jgi:hypothetical protein
MAGSSPAMTIRVVACESFSLKTHRDEPPVGLVGRDLAQQNQHEIAVPFSRVPVLI